MSMERVRVHACGKIYPQTDIFVIAQSVLSVKSCGPYSTAQTAQIFTAAVVTGPLTRTERERGTKDPAFHSTL